MVCAVTRTMCAVSQVRSAVSLRRTQQTGTEGDRPLGTSKTITSDFGRCQRVPEFLSHACRDTRIPAILAFAPHRPGSVRRSSEHFGSMLHRSGKYCEQSMKWRREPGKRTGSGAILKGRSSAIPKRQKRNGGKSEQSSGRCFPAKTAWNCAFLSGCLSGCVRPAGRPGRTSDRAPAGPAAPVGSREPPTCSRPAVRSLFRLHRPHRTNGSCDPTPPGGQPTSARCSPPPRSVSWAATSVTWPYPWSPWRRWTPDPARSVPSPPSARSPSWSSACRPGPGWTGSVTAGCSSPPTCAAPCSTSPYRWPGGWTPSPWVSSTRSSCSAAAPRCSSTWVHRACCPNWSAKKRLFRPTPTSTR